MKPARTNQASEIAPGIWMSPGTSNAYMVVTDQHRVIVNCGMGFEALTHKKIFDTACPKPTAFIVLTQGHVDHVGGVNTLREPQTVVIAQQNNAICQHDDERIQTIRSSQAYIWFQPTIDQAIATAREYPDALIQDKPVPDVTFDQHFVFNCDATRFECLATPGGETIDSCVLWLPQTRTLFSGNLFGPLFPHFPNINTLRGDKYRYLEPYIDSLNRVKALEPEILITGHFEPIQGWQLIRDCLERLEQAAQYVHKKTLEGMNAGKDIFTLMKEIRLPESLAVGEGYGKVSWAVRTIWESYMGWFKARYSSELYATPPDRAATELAQLVGIETVLAHASELLERGDNETALLLWEACLAADPSSRTCMELGIRIHQSLLTQTSARENFWENGWLQNQIRQLKKQLHKSRIDTQTITHD
jgi:alkyl sulfatase BDS1-like metallo-beta-lactamase superfamily hydrolase